MEQDSSKIGIIGGGPAGCACAFFIKKFNPNIDVTIIDYSTPMRTILPTGGGRCNLAYSEYDFKELTKNYPRGNKFLFSIFSKFSTSDTLEFFEELGINTYIQDDNRIFPQSNSAKEVQDKLLNAIKNTHIIKEKALRIENINNKFKVITDMNSYTFDRLIYSTGGHNGYDMIRRIGVSIIEPKPSLVGLVTKENLSKLMGIVIKDVYNNETGLQDDILFTHFGISGPLTYKISSIKARDNFPYNLSFDLYRQDTNLQEILNKNPHKFIKNILSDMLPIKLVEFILNLVKINPDTKCHRINGTQRDLILENIHNFKISIQSSKKDGETVTAGGVNLDKINPKTMESKEIYGLYFCGEVIDVDGFCGGFNLQNCWSTAYVAASAICS
ncbi:MAG: aminoacetone oxidase family FAD-binding enzyme [Candidatus Gastranaerophilales bacterium]|nr:aminoacetone oxidase family FAD-binding enzyme [Candidatus Gastranaerophilales bacterium]